MNGQPQNMHLADIKAAITKSGATLQSIAIEAGLNRTSTSLALRQAVPAANEAIAAHLGKTVHDLWPEWFNVDGSQKPRLRKPITRSVEAQRQKRSAA